MKKRIISAVLVVLMLATLTGCHDKKDLALIAELQSANEALTAEVASLKSEVAALRSMSLHSWSITATPAADGAYADVAFSAIPDGLYDGQSVTFEVMLDDQMNVNLPCMYDGTAFTANAQLEAKNGYSFFCTLSDGVEFKREALMDPESAVLAQLMNLGDALNAYCNVIVEDNAVEDGHLNLKLSLNAKLPDFVSSDDSVAVELAQLTFALGEEALETVNVSFEAGDEGLLEKLLDDASFALPEEMDDDAQLTLTLTVKLTNGRVLTALGGTWSMQDGKLSMVTG